MGEAAAPSRWRRLPNRLQYYTVRRLPPLVSDQHFFTYLLYIIDYQPVNY